MKKERSLEEIVELVESKYGIVLVGDMTDINDNHDFICSHCGHQRHTTASRVLQSGCRRCVNGKPRGVKFTKIGASNPHKDIRNPHRRLCEAIIKSAIDDFNNLKEAGFIADGMAIKRRKDGVTINKEGYRLAEDTVKFFKDGTFSGLITLGHFDVNTTAALERIGIS